MYFFCNAFNVCCSNNLWLHVIVDSLTFEQSFLRFQTELVQQCCNQFTQLFFSSKEWWQTWWQLQAREGICARGIQVVQSRSKFYFHRHRWICFAFKTCGLSQARVSKDATKDVLLNAIRSSIEGPFQPVKVGKYWICFASNVRTSRSNCTYRSSFPYFWMQNWH